MTWQAGWSYWWEMHLWQQQWLTTWGRSLVSRTLNKCCMLMAITSGKRVCQAASGSDMLACSACVLVMHCYNGKVPV